MTDTQETLLEQALEWYVVLQDVDATPAEQEQFSAWLHQSSAHQQAWQRAAEVWQRLNPVADHLAAQPSIAQATQPPVYLLNQPQNGQKSPTKVARWLRPIAAILILGVCLTAGLYDPAWLAEYRTAIAEQREWRLEDGSLIRLAPNTAVDVEFSPNQRQIRLHRGEAWFQVATDARRPFIVQAEDGTTQALGTAFDIRRRDDEVRVLVSEHSVLVSLNQQQQRLEQGQAITYNRNGLSSVTAVNLNNELAWQKQRLVFQDIPLKQVLEALQSYLPSHLQLMDAHLGQLPVTAVFNTRQPQQALDTLAEVLGLRLTSIGPWLTLVRSAD